MELLKGSSKHGVTTIQNLSDTECMNETELSMPVKDVQEGGVLRPKLDGCGVVDQFFPFENHCECCKNLASGLCHVVLHSPSSAASKRYCDHSFPHQIRPQTIVLLYILLD